MRKKLNVLAMGILAAVMMASAAHALEIINSELERNVSDDTLNLIIDFDEPMSLDRFKDIRSIGGASAPGTIALRTSKIDSCSQDIEKTNRIVCASQFDGMPYNIYKPTVTDKARGYVVLSAKGVLFVDSILLDFQTKDYEWDIPIEPQPQALMQMAQYIDLKGGQIVDHQLHWHPTFPVPPTAELSFEIAPAELKHPTGLGHRAALPAGLSMSSTGRLTGTLTQAAGGGDFWVFFVSKATEYPDRLYVVPVNFRIAPADDSSAGNDGGEQSKSAKFVFRYPTFKNASIQ